MNGEIGNQQSVGGYPVQLDTRILMFDGKGRECMIADKEADGLTCRGELLPATETVIFPEQF